ncbi:MAG: type II toxin-antitoxin system RelE/ParE family toxin [Desulfurococcales archaeon]|nr:type II toxin-antitoxin system RelE/ParE family toxin [Desulfurococcales archaeon]
MSLGDCFGKWKVTIRPKAEKEARKYSRKVYERLINYLRDLEYRLNSDPQVVHELRGMEFVVPEFKIRKFRIGDYRATFIISYEDCRVEVVGFGHRSKFYDRLRKRGF